MDLGRWQKEAWANKLAHGFNTTDVPADLKRLHGDVDEAIEAREQSGEGLGSEIADTLIYACGLGEMTGADVADEVERYTAEGGGAGLEGLHGVIAEAEEAWEQGGNAFGSKLAKFVTHACAIGEAAGLDMAGEVDRKLVIIAARRYERRPDGRLVKVAADTCLEAG